MQNKGAIRLFAILLALVCIFQLSFTFVSRKIEKDAARYAKGDELKEVQYLDSVSGQTVYKFLFGARKYTYKEVKARELNLGLDLRGGMNVTLEISVVDLVRVMANHTKDPVFNQAIAKALEMQKNSTEGFIDLFGKAYESIEPNGRLAAFFLTPELKDKINFNSTNAQVLDVIKAEADAAISNSFNILRSRIDRFGVTQPNIQLLQRGRILVELPGVKDKDRVRNLLQGTASLEFWETYENQEIYPFLMQANTLIKDLGVASKSLNESPSLNPETSGTNPVAEQAQELNSELTTGEEKKDSAAPSLLDEMKTAKSDSTGISSNADMAKEYPLFAILSPNVNNQGQLFPGPVIGFAHFKDTSKVNQYLALPKVREAIPQSVIFTWSQKPFGDGSSYYQLFALKSTTRDGKAPLDGSAITDARQDFGQSQASAEVNFSLNSEGAKIWARMTKENLKKSIAIVLDGYVVSYPTVQTEITGGRSNITGNFTVEEAKDLANMLKSGKMPAPANIVEEYIVGPTLGKESINAGLWSFIIAFILVLGFMMLMYTYEAGSVANVALLANLFLLMGVLASFGAVLTLPGIAGIVLTVGMAVDANVLIYERIQEEMHAGKGLKLAITDGYKNALSAILDGQLTTLITGIVLYFFGSGPIKGFATTLIIGIATSLFTSIYISRLIFEAFLKKDRKIKFITKFALHILQSTSYKFIQKRKIAYWISGTIIVISLSSIFIKGFDFGIDFRGGRSYIVEFKQDVKVGNVAELLRGQFGSAPEVKTFGTNNVVRITTDYKIEEDSRNIDNQIEDMLYAGLKPIIGEVSADNFKQDYIRSSNKVGPTISDDIKKGAIWAILLSLVGIFIYILIRFKYWYYSVGGIAALAHDALAVLGFFSLFSGLLHFSMEIDQTFIGAILTVIGYSINDTVVIFDRIREYVKIHPKNSMESNMDNAVNHTLRRTLNTSLSVIVVLLAIILFGGASIRGFAVAMLVGCISGVYSTVFIATPIAFDIKAAVDRRKLKKQSH